MTDQLNEMIGLLNRYGETFRHFNTAMFVQVCVLVMILLLLELCLRRKVRAVFRYWMWTLVLLKLVLPVTLYSPASAAYWLTDYRPEITMADFSDSEKSLMTSTQPVPSSVIPAVSDSLSVPLTDRQIPDNQTVMTDQVSPETKAEVIPARGVKSAASFNAVPATLQQLQLAGWLLLVWLSITILLGCVVLWRAWRIRQIVIQSVAAPDELIDLLENCCSRLGLKQGSVQLKISSQLGSPAICGLWKPTVLLPRHLLDKLDREQFLLVFYHELSHWKRFDLHVNCLQILLQVLYFYNPLVWFANAILRRLREQAVDETVLVTLSAQAERYSSTLLDIAALKQRPDNVSLQLIGVIESRHALAQRIRRIVSQPIPKSAKLGVSGFAAIALVGTLLLPMSGSGRSHAAGRDKLTEAASTAIAVVATEKQPQTNDAQDKNSKPKGILHGRIVDETGKPVTDATLKLSPSRGGRVISTTTDEDGYYSFPKINKPGEHIIRVKSQRCVGLERSSEAPRVILAVGTSRVQEIVLQRACQLRITTVDGIGIPVSGVTVYAKSLADKYSSLDTVRTDQQGQATLGLKASETEYLIATSSPNYGFAKLVVRLTRPGTVVSQQMVQHRGVDVQGKVVCSDGKPPAGWRINALPEWWNIGRSPSGTQVAKDGSFTLPHIVSDKYNVTISVPLGRTTFTNKSLLKSTDLTKSKRPLSLKLDYPSPASLVSISGRIHFTAGKPKNGFWIHADSDDRQHHFNVNLRPGETEFHISPIPRGKYMLSVQHSEIESKTIRNVLAPSKDIVLELTVRGKPKLRGTVLQADGKQPLNEFRVRAIKVRSLQGAHFAYESRWHKVENPAGKFDIEVVGPGIYTIQVAADGFAWASSEQVNTEQNKSIRLELVEGVSLTGMVVNEQGRPVDGAQVIPLSKASGTSPGVAHRFTTNEGAAKTVRGKFTLKHLTPGPETLKVVHPDYTFKIVEKIEIGAKPGSDKLKITLKRGGAVSGRVFNAQGQPEPHVTLFFKERTGYSGGGDNKAGLFATAVTNEEGYYEVFHLPEQLCYVHRANEWQALGVVRQAVLPKSGKTRILNLGGRSKLYGRLMQNGVPLANTKLILSGENPSFGIFKAYAQTTDDGSFVFNGAGPGERTLYYAVRGRLNDWIRVKSFRLMTADRNLGTIDHKIGRLVVRIMSEAGKTDNLRLRLFEYNPIWPHGLKVGVLAQRKNNTDPFVFEAVPPGNYELVSYQPQHPSVRKRVEITASQLDKTVNLQLPRGTASLRGKLDKAIFGPGVAGSLKLWSQDKRLQVVIIPNDQGTYAVENIPAGNYYLTDKDTRDAAALIEVSLKAGEAKTLNLTPEVIKKSVKTPGFRVFQVFTSNGVPLPGCKIQLTGPGGLLSPHIKQNGGQTFVGDPGTYDLTVTYPGFHKIQRKVELILPGPNGRYPKHVEVTLQLQLQSKGQ